MDQIAFDDFLKLDIRIGTVTKAEVPDWSHWVMKLTVDFGEELGERIIFAGIMKFYKPEELEGNQYPFVVNLAPKKMGPSGDYSNGMMLAASHKSLNPEDEKPVLFRLTETVPNGTSVH